MSYLYLVNSILEFGMIIEPCLNKWTLGQELVVLHTRFVMFGKFVVHA